MQIQKTDNTSFKMLPLASAEARFNRAVNQFKLYKITPKDSQYIETLRNTINLRERMPNLKEEHYQLWSQILKMTLKSSGDTILLTKDNEACGALNYKKSYGDYYIEGQVTWPIKPGVREPFAGKVLMMSLFNLFMKDDCKLIRACVVRNNPFGTISKCMEMGFRSNGGDNYNELMCVTRDRVRQVLDKFKDIIKIEDSLVSPSKLSSSMALLSGKSL